MRKASTKESRARDARKLRTRQTRATRDREEVAWLVYMAIERAAAIARLLGIALYHDSDSARVDDARLGLDGIAQLLGLAADGASDLHTHFVDAGRC